MRLRIQIGCGSLALKSPPNRSFRSYFQFLCVLGIEEDHNLISGLPFYHILDFISDWFLRIVGYYWAQALGHLHFIYFN